jgi:hypothetical protein
MQTASTDCSILKTETIYSTETSLDYTALLSRRLSCVSKSKNIGNNFHAEKLIISKFCNYTNEASLLLKFCEFEKDVCNVTPVTY